MSLICEKTSIPGVLVFTPDIFGDARGFFLQTYQTREYAAAGLDRAFVQDNCRARAAARCAACTISCNIRRASS